MSIKLRNLPCEGYSDVELFFFLKGGGCIFCHNGLLERNIKFFIKMLYIFAVYTFFNMATIANLWTRHTGGRSLGHSCNRVHAIFSKPNMDFY